MSRWQISGDISGRAFVLDCRFDKREGQLNGQCTEIDKNGEQGKRHVLSRGSVRGLAISWTYPAKIMMMSIDIDFVGKQIGAAITGTVATKGREGAFTARKL